MKKLWKISSSNLKNPICLKFYVQLFIIVLTINSESNYLMKLKWIWHLISKVLRLFRFKYILLITCRSETMLISSPSIEEDQFTEIITTFNPTVDLLSGKDGVLLVISFNNFHKQYFLNLRDVLLLFHIS